MKHKTQLIVNISAGILILAVIAAVALILIRGMNAEAEKGAGLTAEHSREEETNTEKWQEGVISYQGREYRYQTGIRTYLFLGIDREGIQTEASDYNSGGQSDAMFLLVTDPADKTVSIVAINRNTMTSVEVYDVDGDYADTRELQICLQHAYGDGGNLSCQRSADAVSRLFYDIPVTGYLSLNMDGISLLNDAVGGVTLQVMDDLENPQMGVSLKKGETVTLNGNEAYVYLRSRDQEIFDSSGRRLERQQQYLIQLFSTMASAGKDEAKLMKIHDAVQDYLVTNIDLLRLVEELNEYQFDSSRMYSVPGETIMGNRLEEYHVDQEAFYEMILEIFYEPLEGQIRY